MDKQLGKLLKIALSLIILITIFFLLPYLKNTFYFIFKLVLPFLIGFTIAFILTPIVEQLEQWHVRRKVAAVFVFFLFLAIFVGFCVWIIPILIHELNHLIENLPDYVQNIKAVLDKICKRFDFLPNNLLPSPENVIEYSISNVNQILSYFMKIVQSTFSYIIVFIISPILTLYFMLDYHELIEKGKKWLIKHGKEKQFPMFRELQSTMRAYFKGVIFVMALLSTVSALCFQMIGLDLSILWGLIIGITNVIPYIGPYIGGAVVGIFTLSTYPSKTLMVVVIIIVLQIIESNFITPQVESKTVKTHPILAIFFLTFFGQLLGIFGMILAIPLLSIFQILLKYRKTN